MTARADHTRAFAGVIDGTSRRTAEDDAAIKRFLENGGTVTRVDDQTESPKPKKERKPKLRDRRRFPVAIPPRGTPKAASQEAQDQARTIFPNTVVDPSHGVLRDGANNRKIGGDVLLGRLKGARIYTVSLEERATCPRACEFWGGCYGNSMQMAKRIDHKHPDFATRLEADVIDAAADGNPLLVRLHVLGDFFDFEYLKLWARMLDDHPGLHIFGFTAWLVGTKIGDGVAKLREVYPDRWMIRHSNSCDRWGSFTVDQPTLKKRMGNAILCPEQREALQSVDSKRHCGSCGVCWSGTDAPIVFVEH